MFRELRDLIIEGLHLLLLYGFLYVCAIGVITIFIANVPKNSPEVIYHVTPAPRTYCTDSYDSQRIGVRRDMFKNRWLSSSGRCL